MTVSAGVLGGDDAVAGLFESVNRLRVAVRRMGVALASERTFSGGLRSHKSQVSPSGPIFTVSPTLSHALASVATIAKTSLGR